MIPLELDEAIEKRRSYRSLEPVEITDNIMSQLAEAAKLAASCYNNQPWRYVFAYDPGVLEQLKEALSRGNAWAREASLIIAVCSREDLDCVVKDRRFYLFDTGMAAAHLLLKAVDLGLVAHPIAGFSPTKAREVLDIPEDVELPVLIIVGKKAGEPGPALSEKQMESEKTRPERLSLDRFVFKNKWASE